MENVGIVFKMSVFVTKIRLGVLDEETSVTDMKLFEKNNNVSLL